MNLSVSNTEHPISLAVVGAGYWGPNLIRNFSALPGCQVTWVCDAKPGRQAYIAEKFPGLRITDDYSTILRDSDVDAIAIATPVSTHCALATAALQAGKHVFIEKPLADTVAHAESIVAAGEQAGRVVATDHLFVYNPAIAKMKELIDQGQIGGLCYAESGRVNLGPPASEVDVIWDLATHDLAITYYLWGRMPVEVTAFGTRFLHPKLIDVVFLHLRFDDDSLAVHHASWLSPEKVRRYFLAGRSGSFVFDDTVAQGKLRQVDQGVDSRIGLKDSDVKDLFYRPGVVSTPELEPVQPLEASCREFLVCIQSGRRPRADGHAGLAVVRILEAAEQSIAEGSRPVTLTRERGLEVKNER
jgi:predicted dehydrogenase